jgi:HK97 family phage prohead protease
MKDQALKKITDDVAAELRAWLEQPTTKAVIAETRNADDSTGTFEVVITTENLDRYQEVIKLDGWNLVHYRNNPVVLWGHDHNQPIGIATSVEIIDGKMIARGKFAPTEKAQEIRRLYDFGIIKATSVGFLEKEREGNLITKAELLEFSFVSVPANPYALSLAMEKELSVNELVTKGLMFVEREAPAPDTIPEEKAEEPAPAEVPAPAEEPEPVAEEKSISIKAVDPIIASLKGAIVALEALSQRGGQPEGNEAPVDATEEEKKFAEFTANRKLLQDAATVIGDVLAEARQAMAAK